MALTRDDKETVLARIEREPECAPALFAEATGASFESQNANRSLGKVRKDQGPLDTGERVYHAAP